MENIYTSGEYLESTQTWHAEDSPWKARQIMRSIHKNKIEIQRVAEIGCGSGLILKELSGFPEFKATHLEGYDISQQAIELANKMGNEKICFFNEDLLSDTNNKFFDLLLIIDVFEHVPDYLSFISQCKTKAKYKLFHIPLDIHVSSVLRHSFTRNRHSIGHLHYFSEESAICTIEDTGCKVIDTMFTNGAIGLFKEHPSLKKAIANMPRWLFSKLNVPLAARLFGGYSLLVLAE